MTIDSLLHPHSKFKTFAPYLSALSEWFTSSKAPMRLYPATSRMHSPPTPPNDMISCGKRLPIPDDNPLHEDDDRPQFPPRTGVLWNPFISPVETRFPHFQRHLSSHFDRSYLWVVGRNCTAVHHSAVRVPWKYRLVDLLPETGLCRMCWKEGGASVQSAPIQRKGNRTRCRVQPRHQKSY